MITHFIESNYASPKLNVSGNAVNTLYSIGYQNNAVMSVTVVVHEIG